MSEAVKYVNIINHESVAAYINALRPKLRPYASQYWNHLSTGAAQPKYDPDEVSYTQAQQTRLALTKFL